MKLSVRHDRPCGTLTAFILLCGVHICWNGVHARMSQQLPDDNTDDRRNHVIVEDAS
jgi:hypothetical protein